MANYKRRKPRRQVKCGLCTPYRALGNSKGRQKAKLHASETSADRRVVEIDPEQAWFWTDEWQAGEREADEDLRLGRYEEFDTIDEMFDSL